MRWYLGRARGGVLGRWSGGADIVLALRGVWGFVLALRACLEDPGLRARDGYRRGDLGRDRCELVSRKWLELYLRVCR